RMSRDPAPPVWRPELFLLFRRAGSPGRVVGGPPLPPTVPERDKVLARATPMPLLAELSVTVRVLAKVDVACSVPLPMVRPAEEKPRLLSAETARVPALIVIVPVKPLLSPLRVSVPAPFWMSAPVPLRTPP